MLITSKFTDYYDESVDSRINSNILYHRTINNINLGYDNPLYKRIDSILKPVNDLIYKFKDSNAIIRPFYIGFCGKIYQGYTYIPSIKNSNENIYGFCRDSFPAEILKMPFNKRFSLNNTGFKNFEELLNSEPVIIDNDSIFHNRKLVSFFFEDSVSKTIFSENAKLSDFGFEHVFNGHDAANEIVNFISNVLNQKDNDIITISDDSNDKTIKKEVIKNK